jgi:hypothetical protein
MSNEVYANGREVSCKAGSGKSTCAFPDVCFTPPENPATPPGVPIPYPNTGLDSDATEGSKTVKISDKEVMLKNKSYFSKSTGDEAGCAAKKGVLTSVNRGKVYFNAWSMDVKIEGENVVRHLDITTHNHASFPGNSPTWPFIDAADFDETGPCKDVAKKIKDECLDYEKPKGRSKKKTKLKPKQKLVVFTKKSSSKNIKDRDPADVERKESMEKMCAKPKCREAMKCVVSPYSPNNCCPQPQPEPPEQTPHHIVPDSQFKSKGSKTYDLPKRTPPPNPGYSHGSAPCICAEGTSHSTGIHGEIHTETSNETLKAMAKKSRKNVSKSGKSIAGDPRWDVSEAEAIGSNVVAKKMQCDPACIAAQVRRGNEAMGIRASDRIRPQTAGKVTKPIPPAKKPLRR